jgi:hypothetical protein
MKILRMILCAGMICFLLLSPSKLVQGAQESYVDARFQRDPDRYTGSIVLYHIVRHRPYSGSLTQWLRTRAETYEKKHKGTYIEIEGIDEKAFRERMEGGRRPDAYSFFSGSLYPDRLQTIPDLGVSLREGLFRADRCVPYCFSGYCKLLKHPDGAGKETYCADEILATRVDAGENTASEEKADILYLDLRRAGDLIRYKDGFALSQLEPIDSFTDAVCWLGIDRETDAAKAAAILDFTAFLLTPESQQTLDALGLFSVRSDVRQTPPDPILKRIYKTYRSIQTVDPFLWQQNCDALREDAQKARKGDGEAHTRFTNRLRECFR